MSSTQIAAVLRRRIPLLAVLGALAAFGALAAAQANPAFAQQPPGSPAFCEQYPSHPACQASVILPPTDPGVGTAPPGPTAAAGVTPVGQLPFTGYPITPLLLLLLVLLLAGLTIRAYLAIRDRLRAGSGPPAGA